ncbi:MAG TPA: primosomal protein N' [Candidatus Hydrogenedentes bacterium]|nr:primosomal protein N' [Candidatus Hydrogenedentota bacterium]
MNRPLFADVALPLPIDGPFTYSVPESLRERIVPGMRVVVPVKGRTETAYVVAVHDRCDRDDLRPIKDLPDERPVFTQHMLDLTRWLADYYCCSWGEALQCAVPAGINVRTKMRYTLCHDQLGPGRFTERQKRVVAELHKRGPLTEGQLAVVVGQTALSNTLHSLTARGLLIAEPVVASHGVTAQTETFARIVDAHIPSPEDLLALQRRAPRQAAVYLDLLHNEPERAATSLYEKHKINSTILAALEEKGLIVREEREYFRVPDIAADPKSAIKHTLNDEQQAAFDAINTAMTERRFQTFLLEGITGSGKTEVYLQAIERALELNLGAIILVPEISLTPQTVGRFKARFQANIAVLHSGLGKGERYDEWRRAQLGEVRIVVGARSAIFAPLPDVGIIVVDEEHDTSYKQSETPRYHARDVAIMRAKMQSGVCVLGSATPSIESRYNSETGKSTLIALRRRATNAALPEVQLIDMRSETREHGANLVLSHPLEQAVSETVAKGEQAILLLNRRGFSPYVLCPMCGWVAECDQCNISLTYHAKGAFLACHYCNTRYDVPQVCDKCGFNPLLFLGTGTQKAEEYLLHAFPKARVERMDADTTAGKGGHAKILGRFAAGEIDILIGTQMIAKGHDYPGVTLVGVINADAGLALPDFRAAENTFQLLTQVAGRAGRGDKPGRVIMQTFRPNHYAVQAALHHDYAGFYTHEIEQRKQAAYPPLRRMAHLAIESEDLLLAERMTATLHRTVREQIERLGFTGVEILGPSPATVRRVKRQYRWNLGLLSRSATRLNALARATRDAFADTAKISRVMLKIDLDPYGMY